MVTKERFDQLFIYEPETGALFWKVRHGSAQPGNRAGYFGGTVRTVQVDRQVHCIHRLIWERYVAPIPPALQIDHINGNADDNRLINFRQVTNAINSRNQPRKTNNTSGHTGVYYIKRDNKWAAEMMVDRKKLWIGRFHRLEDAVAARRAAQIPYGFHENHGQRDIIQRASPLQKGTEDGSTKLQATKEYPNT